MNFREEIRELETSSKFEGTNRRRAAMLYLIVMDGGVDESHSWSDDGDGMERIGRHVLEFDSAGFVSVVSFPTEEKASEAFTSAAMRDYMANGYQ